MREKNYDRNLREIITWNFWKNIVGSDLQYKKINSTKCEDVNIHLQKCS